MAGSAGRDYGDWAFHRACLLGDRTIFLMKANKTLKPELSLKIQRLLPDYMMNFLNTLKATLLLTLMMTSIYSDCSLLT